MNNDQNVQQNKSNPKGKAVASLVLGIISIVGSAIIFASYASFLFPSFWRNIVFQSYIMGWIITIFFIFGGIFSICGLTFGIIGLKSTKKILRWQELYCH